MPRIKDLDVAAMDPRIEAVLEAQRKKWGAPLVNHLLYARRPAIFRGVRGMWSGIAESGLIPGALQALINRRVAFHNGCVF